MVDAPINGMPSLVGATTIMAHIVVKYKHR
jgi:hypothetical protein